MTKLSRRLIVGGRVYIVEVAVRADSSEPAWAFLEDLRNGVWLDDPSYPDGSEGDPEKSDEQVHDYARILAIIKYIANEGIPPHRNSVNYLGDGMWEIKYSNRRLTFFDTPGDGTYAPKGFVNEAPDPNPPEAWWFPDFDDYIRLGHAFPKVGQKSGEFNISTATSIRREDLNYDEE